MKKRIILFVVTSMCIFTSCTKDNDDVDPIIGIWYNDTSITQGDVTTSRIEEWIFVADNTGQFSKSTDGVVGNGIALTWSNTEGVYEILLPNSSSPKTYTIGALLGSKTLVDSEGYTVAIKE